MYAILDPHYGSLLPKPVTREAVESDLNSEIPAFPTNSFRYYELVPLRIEEKTVTTTRKVIV